MSFMDKLRGLFSSNRTEEAAAEREEYGLPDERAEELPMPGNAGYAGVETERLAEDELDEFKAPPDPAP